MVTWESRKLGDLLVLGNGLLLLLLLNLFGSWFFFTIDLTEEKRYSLKDPTKRMLSRLEDVVYVEVFLEGDLNVEFKRLRNAVRETLDVFNSYSGNKVHYRFINPVSASGQQARNEFVQELASKGIQMLPVFENRDGERIEKIVFPGALVTYGGSETAVTLFKSKLGLAPQEVLKQSMEGLEYELASTIYKLINENRKSVAFLTGHGELDDKSVASLRASLVEQYDVASLDLRKVNQIQGYDLLIIAKPLEKISEADKFKLDQYIINGGNLLLFLDQMDAVMDSASTEDYFAFPYDLGLEDQLFRYGLRVNFDLIQDRLASVYPVVTSTVGNQPQIVRLEWPFYPLINQYADHPVTRNMDAALTRFVSSMDTVRADGIKKVPLLMSSPYARRLSTPVQVSINNLRRSVDPALFREGPIPVAYLLEGRFVSLFKSRFLPDGVDGSTYKETGVPAKIIVVSDGDFIRNDVNARTGQPRQLGMDMTGRVYSNQDLALNMVAYLTDEHGLITARNKEFRIRPLDKQRIATERTTLQFVNLVLPLIFLVVFGLGRNYMRRRIYSRAGT